MKNHRGIYENIKRQRKPSSGRKDAPLQLIGAGGILLGEDQDKSLPG
jgi:hypothetical protein